MGDKTDVWQGTLALMVLKTLATMGAGHVSFLLDPAAAGKRPR